MLSAEVFTLTREATRMRKLRHKLSMAIREHCLSDKDVDQICDFDDDTTHRFLMGDALTFVELRMISIFLSAEERQRAAHV